MNRITHHIAVRLTGAACWIPLLAACGCDRFGADAGRKPAPPKDPPPAKIESPVKEADLTRIVLTESAERRLGIISTPVIQKSLPLTRLFGGTAMIPQGGTVSLAAPLAGTLLTAESDLPTPGTVVKANQVLLRLAPVLTGVGEVLLLSPGDRLALAKVQADLAASRTEAEGRVKSAEAQLEAAMAALERASTLLREGAGSQQGYEQALAASRKSEADLKAARAGVEILGSINLEIKPESAAALQIKAPMNGIVAARHVRGGMEIPAGAPLFDISTLDPIWVRVPVYVGESAAISPEAGARIGLPGMAADAWEASAKWIQPVPTGDPVSASVDLYFELPNPDFAWKPGQRVLVRLPLKRAVQADVVPWSAVVFDVYGGAWVYVVAGPHTYVRRQVEVSEVIEGLAVLARGPDAGTPVVITGTAELFGTEFGSGK